MRRGPAERALAWLYTGPLGHLWSIVGDLGSFFVSVLLAQARRRVPGALRRSSRA